MRVSGVHSNANKGLLKCGFVWLIMLWAFMSIRTVSWFKCLPLVGCLCRSTATQQTKYRGQICLYNFEKLFLTRLESDCWKRIFSNFFHKRKYLIFFLFMKFRICRYNPIFRCNFTDTLWHTLRNVYVNHYLCTNDL